MDARAIGKKPKAKSHDCDLYPPGHKLGMEVPQGGSSCAKCRFVGDDGTICGNEGFEKWNGSPELPAPAERYCCDLFEAGGG